MYIKVDRHHSLEDVFKELQEEMRSQYAIGYTPINPEKDGTFRKLDVRSGGQESESAGAQGLLRR